MKKRDLIELQNALTKIEGRQFTVKFSYFIAKNKVLIKNEFTALEEARRPSAGFVEFDRKRAELAQDLSDKDTNGQSRIENNNFVIVENLDEFKTKLDKLKETYKKQIKEQEQKIQDFEEILNEEIDFKGPKINFKDIPSTIEPSILEVLIIADLIIEEKD